MIEFVRPQREDTFHRNNFVPVNKRSAIDVAALAHEAGAMKKLKSSEPEDKETEGGLLPKPAFVLFPRARVAAMLSWPKMAPIGAGLRNVGNTCYLNSVMQCLAYTPPLFNYVASQEHLKRCQAQAFCPLCALCRLVTELHSKRGHSVVPAKFTSNLRLIAPTMRGGRQEDSHEWLRYLVESMQVVLEKEAGGGKKLPPNVCETTWLQHMFGGYIVNELACTVCGFCSRRTDPVMDLNLEILGCSTVDECLRQFTRVEDLHGSNAWKCDKCEKKQPARKQMKILRSPHVLTLQLKLFTPQGQKRNKKVSFDTELNLSEFMADVSDKREPQSYSLYAVLVHTGQTTRSGHYTAFVKAPNGAWYHMDDDSVSQVQLGTVLKQNAYMLFYVRNIASLVPKRTPEPRNSNGVNGTATTPPAAPRNFAYFPGTAPPAATAAVPALAPMSPVAAAVHAFTVGDALAPVDAAALEVPSNFQFVAPLPVSRGSHAALTSAFAGLKEKEPRHANGAKQAEPSPVASGASTKEFGSLLKRSQSVAEFEAWDKNAGSEKKLSIIQKALKEKALSRARVPMLDPVLDAGRVKKVRAKRVRGEEGEAGESYAAQMDRVAKQKRSNKQSQRPKQQMQQQQQEQGLEKEKQPWKQQFNSRHDGGGGNSSAFDDGEGKKKKRRFKPKKKKKNHNNNKAKQFN